MDVISLDNNRVKIYEKKVVKKSNLKEFMALIKAKEFCEKLGTIEIMGQSYQLCVPGEVEFKNNYIHMERCFGDNLEIILRNKETHDKGVVYLNTLASIFLKNNFFWNDFAPRNIIIGENKIYILDFEKGISDYPIKDNLYFMYEEYSAFLLPNEKIYDINSILSIKPNSKKTIKFKEIKSRRIKQILNYLGYDEEVSYDKYVLAIKMILANEEPYKKEDDLVFPLVELEELLIEKGHKKYAKKILEGYYGTTKKI